MKQIRCIKSTPLGICTIIFRFVGKYIFIKKRKNSQEVNQMISQLKQKGADIIESGNWIRVDLFKNNELVKLGNIEINMKETSPEEIEELLTNFYINLYKKGGFRVIRDAE